MTLSMQEIIGREVRVAMVRKGWDTRDLAGNLDIMPATLSRYLRGDRDIPSTTLLTALRMLDVDLSDFGKRVDEEIDVSVEQACGR